MVAGVEPLLVVSVASAARPEPSSGPAAAAAASTAAVAAGAAAAATAAGILVAGASEHYPLFFRCFCAVVVLSWPWCDTTIGIITCAYELKC